MSSRLSRAAFVRRGVGGGVALLASGSVATALARPALALTAPDGDLAALRLLVGAELLAIDFQTQALASRKLGREAAAIVTRMRADEQAHYNALADLLAQAGQTATTSGDIDFSYPKGTFATDASMLKVATELEQLQLGAYIGANANVQTPQLRVAIGQIAANEAQHTAALAVLVGKPVIGKAFGPALQPDAVTAVLDVYES